MSVTFLVWITFSLRYKHFKYTDFCLTMINENNLLLQEVIIVTETISHTHKKDIYVQKNQTMHIDSLVYSYKHPSVFFELCSLGWEEEQLHNQ